MEWDDSPVEQERFQKAIDMVEGGGGASSFQQPNPIQQGIDNVMEYTPQIMQIAQAYDERNRRRREEEERKRQAELERIRREQQIKQQRLQEAEYIENHLKQLERQEESAVRSREKDKIRRESSKSIQDRPSWGKVPENINYDKSEKSLSGEDLWDDCKNISDRAYEQRQRNKEKRKEQEERDQRLIESLKKIKTPNTSINSFNEIEQNLVNEIIENPENFDLDAAKLRAIQNQFAGASIETIAHELVNKIRLSKVYKDVTTADGFLSFTGLFDDPLDFFKDKLKKIIDETSENK